MLVARNLIFMWKPDREKQKQRERNKERELAWHLINA